jgi:hypothetical protein
MYVPKGKRSSATPTARAYRPIEGKGEATVELKAVAAHVETVGVAQP